MPLDTATETTPIDLESTIDDDSYLEVGLELLAVLADWNAFNDEVSR